MHAHTLSWRLYTLLYPTQPLADTQTNHAYLYHAHLGELCFDHKIPTLILRKLILWMHETKIGNPILTAIMLFKCCINLMSKNISCNVFCSSINPFISLFNDSWSKKLISSWMTQLSTGKNAFCVRVHRKKYQQCVSNMINIILILVHALSYSASNWSGIYLLR